MGEESVEENLWPVYDNGIWRIRTNKELMVLYQELDMVAEIKKARLRWLGHIERMSEDRVIKKTVYEQT
jgi:hypothetical protein